ncbi:MAG: sulfurtransferase [Xanthobacteraceae bacterium]|nr:sulfurtransferase [Xanthobacteraceae bacterium]
MSAVAASLPRRAFVAAVVAFAALVSLPALGATIEPLVTPQWLNENRSSPDVVVLDIRSAIDGGGTEAYLKAHIPDAVHSDYDKAGWRVTRNGVPFMLPTVAQLEKLIGETGIDEDNHVVIVPAGVSATDFGSAARVYWTLKAAGHPAVSILDGGFAAWQAAALPVESGTNPPSPKIFSAKPDNSLLAEIEAVERNAVNATLLDGRPASFFEGRQKAPAAKAYGHIPGAINLDSATFYDPATNKLRSKAELADIAAKLSEGPVVSYCNTGHWAATNWFVLSVMLGRPDVRLYDGSMVEWTADARRPVASSRTRWDDVKKALGFGS